MHPVARLFGLSLLFCSLAAPVLARSNAGSEYEAAFEALDSNQIQEAMSIANRGPDVVLNKVLRGYAMAQPANNYSFEDLSRFISDHPDWPNLSGILMIAEQKIPDGAPYQTVVNWFDAHPPLTPVGFYRYMDALEALGQHDSAVTLIRSRWITRDFGADEIGTFQTKYASLLTRQDHWQRLDRLLWDNNAAAARGMYPLADPATKALAEARLALAGQTSGAESFVLRVPANRQNDAGLLFERLRWRRKANLDDEALEILARAPHELVRPDKWWDERNILIRRVMERKDFTLAYKLARAHGLSAGFDYLQAEFLSGWLALRFLKKPELAKTHFENMDEAASTPVSRARAAYWLGRTQEALGNKHEAEQNYETAATLNTTFYGQLASTRLYTAPTIRAAPEPTIPANVRNQFFARDVIQAVEKLNRLGQASRARSFFKAAQDFATKRVEFALLMELAYQLQRPDWAIMTAKAAAQKNMLVAAGAFPVLSLHIPTPPDAALTHALIRQESLFNADAGSGAGAKGLMQLMPGTAKDVARKLGVPYRPGALTDPDYNVKLGTSFVQEQLDKFDGSYILALAGYNAGPRRAREWMALFGDPRTSAVDPIDWIELIPIYETRNYVQRIIENLQFYRARLNKGQAPLLILQDLRR